MALTDKLTAIADAIREKTGGTEPLTLEQMPTEIAAIETGGGGMSAEAFLAEIQPEFRSETMTSVRQYAFYMLSEGFVSVDLPNVQSVGDYAFGSCNQLSQINMPNLEETASSAFNCCFALTDLPFPNLRIIGSGSFSSCNALTHVTLPSLTDLGSRAFSDCKGLTTVTLPKLQTVSTYAFYRCTALKTVDLGGGTVPNYMFNGCSSLTALILRTTGGISSTGTYTFTGTPIASGTGYIYVPRSRMSSYQSQSSWKQYQAQFRALEDYTVDGTITGALDESKI